MEIDWENFEIGKSLIGKKALLRGGGQVINAFIIVQVIDANEQTGQIKVNNGKTIAEPYMWSYFLRPLSSFSDKLEKLELGPYLVTGNGKGGVIIRKQDGGVFSTIYGCTPVMELDSLE